MLNLAHTINAQNGFKTRPKSGILKLTQKCHRRDKLAYAHVATICHYLLAQKCLGGAT